MARFDRQAHQRSGAPHGDIPACGLRHAAVVGNSGGSQGLFKTVGDDETPAAIARSSHRRYGILLFTGRTGELRQTFRKGRGRKGSTMRTAPIVLLIVAAALLIQTPLLAHHSSAAFDAGKKVILKGTVKEWVYSNPHCMLLLDVKGQDGQIVEWLAETQPPASIFPVGYRRDSFKAGDQVTITVEPFKDGRPYGRIIGAVLADGKLLGPATSPPSTAGAPPQP